MIWEIASIGLFILLICAIIALTKKEIINNSEKIKYENEVNNLKKEYGDLENNIKFLNENINKKTEVLEEYKEAIQKAQEKYTYETRSRTEELNNYIANSRAKREEELDKEFREKEDNIKLRYEKIENEAQARANCAIRAAEEIIENKFIETQKVLQDAQKEQEKFQAILEPLQQYEKDQQQRLYYTIQVPDEYKEDINFLLTTVAAKVQHPDVINKLVWTEYVKPYISDTFKRANITEDCGIYKLTSLKNGKCYIGKSVNIKKRITDHMKASVGIESIAYQKVHDIILKEGFWNWTIEPVIYCSKEQLNEMEKYYIEFFHSNTFGYNITKGGEG